jgi:hypothetical protein
MAIGAVAIQTVHGLLRLRLAMTAVFQMAIALSTVCLSSCGANISMKEYI